MKREDGQQELAEDERPRRRTEKDSSSSSLWSRLFTPKNKKKSSSSSSSTVMCSDSSTTRNSFYVDPLSFSLPREEEIVSLSELRQEALKHEESHHYEDAIQVWTQALYSHDEKDVDILSRLVSLHLKLAKQQDWHCQAAVRYMSRLDHYQQEWIDEATSLLVVLMEQEAWGLALFLAEVVKEDVLLLAYLHLQVAAGNSDEESRNHLQLCRRLLNQKKDDRCKRRRELLHQLANEWAVRGECNMAVECYRELYQLQTCPRERAIVLYQQVLDIHLPLEEYATSLRLIERGLENLNDDDSVAMSLLQLKADIYYKMKQIHKSIELYKQLLQLTTVPFEKAKILYMLGRLCIRCKSFKDAAKYFQQELELEQGNDLEVSCILHELGWIYEMLGDYHRAIFKYEKALRLEHKVLNACRKSNCAYALRDATQQIKETSKCLGRVHFKLGNFERALQTSFTNIGQ